MYTRAGWPFPTCRGSELKNDDLAQPALERLRDRIRAADTDRTPLRIHGGGTKDFYGGALQGQALDTREYRGIVGYEATELVITARCGTPLAELQAALAENRQWLPFEPPAFGDGATVGGVVAAGLSGPGRAAAGAVRDYVLGAAMIDAQGRALNFGGQVMKNVAGYDVSRLLCGSLGILGLIAEVSLKVLPQPAASATVRMTMPAAKALRRLNEWGGRPLPISASAWYEGRLSLRLSGARAAVDAALATFANAHGAERMEEAAASGFWNALREQRLPFFDMEAGGEAGGGRGTDLPLWRLSLPSTAAPINLPGDELIEWGGAQRWWRSAAAPEEVRALAAAAGGHATLFRGGSREAAVFAPLSPPIHALHRRLKAEFDPNGIFNRGRLVPDL
jgi:glycolate oxidase FAD binding subunit